MFQWSPGYEIFQSPTDRKQKMFEGLSYIIFLVYECNWRGCERLLTQGEHIITTFFVVIAEMFCLKSQTSHLRVLFKRFIYICTIFHSSLLLPFFDWYQLLSGFLGKCKSQTIFHERRRCIQFLIKFLIELPPTSTVSSIQLGGISTFCSLGFFQACGYQHILSPKNQTKFFFIIRFQDF